MTLSKNMKEVLQQVYDRKPESEMSGRRGYKITTNALINRGLIRYHYRPEDPCLWDITRQGMVALGLKPDQSPTVRIKIPSEWDEPKWARSWWKVVHCIDRSKKGGYAIPGKFLGYGEHDLEVDTVILQVEVIGEEYEDRLLRQANIYRVIDSGQLRREGSYSWSNEHLTILDKLAGMIGLRSIKFDRCSDQELIRELEVRGYDVNPGAELLKELAKKGQEDERKRGDHVPESEEPGGGGGGVLPVGVEEQASKL